MRFIITPAVHKACPQLPINFVTNSKNLMISLMHLDLEIFKHLKQRLPIGLFTITNDLIKDLKTYAEDTVIVKLASFVSGGKNGGYVIGAILIIVGIVVARNPQLAALGYSMIVSGALNIVQTALYRPPTFPGLGEGSEAEDLPSYNISRFSNKIGQEYPIAITYGYTPVAGLILDYIEDGTVQAGNVIQTVLARIVNYRDVGSFNTTIVGGTETTITVESNRYRFPEAV